MVKPRSDGAAASDGHVIDGEIQIRAVACLGGCPDDGVIAVDVCATIADEASTSGDLADWQVPLQLKDRISSITQKRTPQPSPGRG